MSREDEDKEARRWIYFDGAEPALVRPLLDALRDLPPEEDAPDDEAAASRRLLSRIGERQSMRASAAAAAGTSEAPVEQPAMEPAPPPAPAPARPGAEQSIATTALSLGIPADVRARFGKLSSEEPVPPAKGHVSAAAPALDLREYASLRAELWVWPERAAEIHTRYRITSAAAWEALHAHWAARLGADEGERAAFERAVGEYAAWLRARCCR